MPSNLELKARLASLESAEATARSCGASFQGVLHQEDTYFVVPKGRLKLREVEGLTAELIYYERGEDQPERWCLYSKEPVTNGGTIRQMLAASLGVFAVVKKRRVLYRYKNARIHLDLVEGLGEFLEFEVEGDRKGESEVLMEELRGLFSIAERDIVRASYSDLMIRVEKKRLTF